MNVLDFREFPNLVSYSVIARMGWYEFDKFPRIINCDAYSGKIKRDIGLNNEVWSILNGCIDE